MKLKAYKKRGKHSVQEIADMFSVAHRTVYNWLKEDADINLVGGEHIISSVIVRASKKEERL